MVLIQVLLPTTTEASAPNNPLRETARELGEAFGGLTAYTRSPAKGVWTSPEGRADEDDVIMVEVVTDRFDRSWWRQYSATLAIRFRQDAIHVRALAIELLDPDAS